MIEIYSNHICQFIEAASHHILNKRGLYPEVIFVSRLAFGIPVKKSVHPGVNQFIEDSLDGLLTALDSRGDSKVEGIDLIIQDYDGDFVEKYAFRFGHVKIKPKQRNVTSDKVYRPVEYSQETQELLRNSLLKLNSRISDLEPIENVKGCSFNFQIYANAQAAKAIQDNQIEVPWQVEKSTDHILDIIASNVPVMSAKENSYDFSIHIDLYNKDLQN